jgi:hypothetical protein
MTAVAVLHPDGGAHDTLYVTLAAELENTEKVSTVDSSCE